MALSKREKYIGIGVGAAVSLWILDAVLLSPYLAQRTTLVAQQASIQQKLNDAQMLFYRRDGLKNIWSDMQKGGLKADSSMADSQAQHAVLDWFNFSGVYLAGLKSDPRPTEEGKFQVIKYHIQGEGHMRQVALLLWAIETATIPVRIDELTVKPRGREGTDDLSVEFGLSTLSITPEANPPVRTSVSLADFTGDHS